MRIQLTLPVILVFMVALVGMGQSPQTTPLPLVPDLNGRAITLVKPDFPESAVVTGNDGTSLVVRVLVDPSGFVIEARCGSCPPMLKDAAELAASTSKFRPLIIDGRPVKYEGILTYAFVVNLIKWAQFGSYLESARQFNNISFGPVAQLLTDEYADERTMLLELNQADYVTRQKGIREVERSFMGKLKGLDLWRFETAMALRRITFWNVASERTNRVALQKAIDDLPTYIAKAPRNVPPAVIEGLTKVSQYKVPDDLGERELRQAVSNLTRVIRLEP